MTDEEFYDHVRVLKNDPQIMFSSSPHPLIDHPSFKAIVAEGRRVIHLILRDFEVEDMFAWDIVLEHIMECSPSPEEHRGFVEKIRQDWLEWGKERGFLV